MEDEGGISARMKNIKHTILVLSGKGGVGKSTISSQLALALAKSGKKVGLLDIDLCGPSIPRLVGLQGKEVHKSSEGWVPVYIDTKKSLSVMSIAFLIDDPDSAVVWRGPKKTAIIKQFLEDVSWGKLDYLIVDTPPGTSDEHISITEYIGPYSDGAIIVTTPQGVSISDVRKEISFCKKVNLPILGVIENMSGFACPCCGEITNVFSTGGGKKMAESLGIPFLAKIPLDPMVSQAGESGKSFIELCPDSTSFKEFGVIVEKLASSS